MQTLHHPLPVFLYRSPSAYPHLRIHTRATLFPRGTKLLLDTLAFLLFVHKSILLQLEILDCVFCASSNTFQPCRINSVILFWPASVWCGLPYLFRLNLGCISFSSLHLTSLTFYHFCFPTAGPLQMSLFPPIKLFSVRSTASESLWYLVSCD